MIGNSRKRKRRSRQRRSRMGRLQLQENALSYSGPIKTPKSSDNRSTYLINLMTSSSITSTGGGVINNVLDNNPSGFGDWSSAAQLFDEYRVLGITVTFMPVNPYNTTRTTRPLISVVDRDSSGLIGSLAAALNYESARNHDLTKTFTVTARASGPGNMSWVTTASPTATFWVKFYSESLTASTEYGLTKQTILVEFRGRN